MGWAKGEAHICLVWALTEWLNTEANEGADGGGADGETGVKLSLVLKDDLRGEVSE